MTVFVTGATGLLGSNLVRELTARDTPVRALARSREKAARQLPDGVEVVEGDLGDVGAFADALDGCDTVFHTAAYFREYFGPGDHEGVLGRLNVDATMELVREADRRGATAFVHTSSSGVIGPAPGGGQADESTPPGDGARRNRYFWSKVEAERAIDGYAPPSGLRVVMVRPGWMFGPGDAAPTGAGDLFLSVCTGRVPGILRGSINVVDARDVAAAMVAAADKGGHGERYNLAGPWRAMPDVTAAIAAAAGVRAPRTLPDWLVDTIAAAGSAFSRLTGRPAMINRHTVLTLRNGIDVSSAKAARELGFRSRPFEETVRDELAWYRAAGTLPG